jgi:hypothetical protein
VKKGGFFCVFNFPKKSSITEKKWKKFVEEMKEKIKSLK